MFIKFRNDYPATVWITTMKYNPGDCGDSGDWEIEGWLQVKPGNDVSPIATGNRYAAFYAEAEDGMTWGGAYGPARVLYHSFDMCIGDATTENTEMIGMRLIDLGPLAWVPYYVHTVRLVA